ncbi:MAG: transcription termination/antitermination NusG family protein [Anaerolineales bacterium]
MTTCWYVLRSKPRKEDFLFGQLQSREIEVYYPAVRVQPVNPRARKYKPYFPGYLFIHVDLEQEKLSALKWMPGAVGLVAFGKEPAWVSDELVNIIRKQVSAVNAAGGENLAGLVSGDEVIIQDGPFDGYKAVFDLSLPGNERVRVLLKLLKDQNMRLELPGSQVRKRKM